MAKISQLAQEAALRESIKAFQGAGWHVRKPSGAEGTPGGPIAYFCHVEEEALIVVSYFKEAFSQLKDFSDKEPIPFKGVCSVTGELIEQAAKEHPAVSDDTRGMLAIAGGLYLMGTKAYQTVKGFPDPQFLVLRYFDVSQNLPLLRPNPLLSDEPLTPHQVELFANQVLAYDRKVHPERFPRATVVPFRAEKI